MLIVALFEDPALEAHPRHSALAQGSGWCGTKLVVGLRYCWTQRSFPWCTLLLRSRGYNGYHNIWRGNETTLHKFASRCTPPGFVFGARFTTPRMAPRTCRAHAASGAPQGAKTRVRVFADIHNFALHAHCVCIVCALRARHSHRVQDLSCACVARRDAARVRQEYTQCNAVTTGGRGGSRQGTP